MYDLQTLFTFQHQTSLWSNPTVIYIYMEWKSGKYHLYILPWDCDARFHQHRIYIGDCLLRDLLSCRNHCDWKSNTLVLQVWVKYRTYLAFGVKPNPSPVNCTTPVKVYKVMKLCTLLNSSPPSTKGKKQFYNHYFSIFWPTLTGAWQGHLPGHD